MNAKFVSFLKNNVASEKMEKIGPLNYELRRKCFNLRRQIVFISLPSLEGKPRCCLQSAEMNLTIFKKKMCITSEVNKNQS